MTDREKLVALALCLKGIDDAYEELADFKASVKARVETLLKESHSLRFEILSGQEQLPLEPTRTESVIAQTLEKVVEEVNSGALDTPGCTVTASMSSPSAEASTEERARTRKNKTRKKLLGQDAILPDPRKPQPGAPA